MFQLIYPYDPAPFLPLPTAEHPGGMNYAGGEMVPIVEPSGLVIGQTARSLAHGGTGLLHPVVHLHVINRNEQLFIQKRSMNKDLLPGRWDTAVGGHVDYGESLETALFREASEELGLREFNPIYLRSYVWESQRERELVNVFAAVGNFRIDPCNEEVPEGRYWSFAEIESALGKDVFTPNFEHEFKALGSSLLALL
ncbi:MAG: NUDIX domain-containing protein [Bacteroidales bacterium]|nr:NUDIX domain-containing protein [Bacteroidales bacterium]